MSTGERLDDRHLREQWYLIRLAAGTEALRFGHHEVDVEHLLLGLLATGGPSQAERTPTKEPAMASPRTDRQTTYPRALAAAAASLPAAALAGAWLVGDLSSPGAVSDLDYALRPLAVPRGVGVAAGVAGVVVLVLAVAVVRRVPGAWPVLACLATAGLLLGGAYRVVTAGVIGANIGAGLAVLLGGPLLLVLLLAAAVLAVRRRPG